MDPIKTPQGKHPSENIWGSILGPMIEKMTGKKREENSLDMKKRREKEEADSMEMSSVSHPKLKIIMAQLKDKDDVSPDYMGSDDSGKYHMPTESDDEDDVTKDDATPMLKLEKERGALA